MVVMGYLNLRSFAMQLDIFEFVSVCGFFVAMRCCCYALTCATKICRHRFGEVEQQYGNRVDCFILMQR